ncbi:unnamed protein product [Acanthosepion pharaonis]|uniref:Transmembrane protein n=1 Tax=Acanthosepion pharaonis TaxID=158019 RepID=A0A812CTT5_ACAPH|nr:unnamed protein product [Sepia pharaonis]
MVWSSNTFASIAAAESEQTVTDITLFFFRLMVNCPSVRLYPPTISLFFVCCRYPLLHYHRTRRARHAPSRRSRQILPSLAGFVSVNVSVYFSSFFRTLLVEPCRRRLRISSDSSFASHTPSLQSAACFVFSLSHFSLSLTFTLSFILSFSLFFVFPLSLLSSLSFFVFLSLFISLFISHNLSSSFSFFLLLSFSLFLLWIP